MLSQPVKDTLHHRRLCQLNSLCAEMDVGSSTLSLPTVDVNCPREARQHGRQDVLEPDASERNSAAGRFDASTHALVLRRVGCRTCVRVNVRHAVV